MPEPPGERGDRSWRAARLLIAGSALAALGVHAWTVAIHNPVPWMHAAGLIVGVVLGRRRSALGLGVLCGAGAVLPGLVMAVGAAPVPLVTVTAVLGWVLAQPDPGRWSLPPWWRWSLAAWGLVVAVTWPIVVARELDFTLASIRGVAQNHVEGMTPADTCAHVAALALAQLTALLFFDTLWRSAASPREQVADRLAAPLGLGLIATSLAALYQAHGDISWLNTPFWVSWARAPGLLGDPNVLGATSALVGTTLAVRAWTRGGAAAGWTATGWLGLALAATLASGSRSALAGWSVGTAGLVLGVVAASRARTRTLLVVAGAAAMLVVGARQASVSGLIAPGNAVARLIATLSRADAFSVDGIRKTLLDRYGYGLAAGAILDNHPLWGVGVGTGEAFLAEYSLVRLGEPLGADNAQNWWRHALVELGTVGSVAPWAASIAVVVALLALVRRTGFAATATRAGSVVGAGIMMLVSVPTQHAYVQVLMAWLLAMALSPLATVTPRRSASRWPSIVPWVFALTCAAGTAFASMSMRPPERALAAGRSYGYGNVPDTGPAPPDTVWIGQRAVGVGPVNGEAFVVRVELPHDDLAAAPVSVVVSNRHGQTCRHLVADHAPVTCTITHPEGATWMLVQVDIGRGWTGPDGRARAAHITMGYQP